MKNKKLISSVIAVALAAGILLGGTFAWQSISQQALNEVYGFVNPGGRLHDDFNEVTNPAVDTTRQFDKNVYVENFTSLVEDGVQVFARIRLDEYMEIGPGAGTNDADKGATSLVPGSVFDQKNTWKTHIPNETDPFHAYWNWTMGGENGDGSTVYMPTFNKNKDSLQADVNGTFAGKDGVPFDDYKPYAKDEKSGVYGMINAIYDADTARDGDEETDELARDGRNVNSIIDGTITLPNGYNVYVTVESEEHIAKETEKGSVITMADWLALPADQKQGNFWVWDIDGWAYWAAPINPDTATGLFLDGIARTPEIINEDWYYGINVVAQFVTADDLGRDDGTGFYDAEAGAAPSFEALQLLSAIGVKVNVEVSTAEELAEAIAIGGTVTLKNDIDLAEVVAVDKDVVIELNGKNITGNADVFKLEGTNGVDLTINGPGKVASGTEDSDCAIWSVGNGSAANTITLNHVDVVGGMCGVYHNGNNFGTTVNVVNETTITSRDTAVFLSGSSAWNDKMNNLIITDSTITGDVSAVEVKQGNVTVTNSTLEAIITSDSMTSNGNGSCSTGYALALTNSGTDATNGAFVVNSGRFTGAVGVKDASGTGVVDNTDEASIAIKGGTFSADPTQYVADGYKVTEKEDTSGNITYTVSVY